jgi:DNA-binding PadR family transcriptional regulator
MRHFHSNPKFDSSEWPDWTRGSWRHGWGGGSFQARRGDIRPILLTVLVERPMHGYEIIRYLEDKSHGLWRPSPGSVYPTLQLLEEEDLVVGRDEGGKKIYELTERGRSEAKAAKSADHFERGREHFERLGEIYGTIAGVIGPFKRLAARGPGPEFDQAVAIMNEAGAKLTNLLGQTDNPKGAAADA